MIIHAIVDKAEVVQEIGSGKYKRAALFTNAKEAAAELRKLEEKDLRVMAFRCSKTIVV